VIPSLYVHIPFCLRKCDYCDFFSVPLDKWDHDEMKRSLKPFLGALRREIDIRKESLDIIAWKTVYIGGGTPSLLMPDEIRELGRAITDNGPVEGEWTIEANPEDVTADWLDACADAGVNRLSLGIQSMNNSILTSVARRGNRKSNEAALELARDRWSGDLSVDLIAGLPGQTQEGFLADVRDVLAFAPDHVSLYSLTVEEGTPLARRVAANMQAGLPGDDLAADLWIAGRDTLVESGYRQYEVSNFARPGHESKHNMTYWNLDTYIGAGPGATGTVITGDTAWRYTDSRDIAAWIADPYAKADEEHIDRDDCIRESLLMGFRLLEGLSLDHFRERFGIDTLDLVGKTIGDWEQRGLAIVDEKKARLTSEGILFLNRFLEDCLMELDKKLPG
jgi:oxygen-independent coproporphyrinogen-3 oxidase